MFPKRNCLQSENYVRFDMSFTRYVEHERMDTSQPAVREIANQINQ